MRCLVVVTKDGCGACNAYHLATEKKLKDYLKKRGDIRYDNIQCEKKMYKHGMSIENPGVAACTVGFDYETGEKKVVDMTYRLGKPFQGDYVFPSFVIYETDPALVSYAPDVVAVKKSGGKNAADIEKWIVEVMGESAHALEKLAAYTPKAFVAGSISPAAYVSPVYVAPTPQYPPPAPKKRSRRSKKSASPEPSSSSSGSNLGDYNPSPVPSPTVLAPKPVPAPESDDEGDIPFLEMETVAIISSKDGVKKKKKSADGFMITEEVAKDDVYCTSNGKCLPNGYEIHPTPGPNGNLRVRRVKQ